jgi:replicative DNA helicase
VSASPFVCLADLMAGWANDVLHGKPPPRWPAGSGPLARFPIAPGEVCLLGGPPGVGKTALANQLAFDAARLNTDLRVVVTCCEMPPLVLLDRQLSRLSGVPYGVIRERAVTADHRPALATAFATVHTIAPRVAFHTGSFSLDGVIAAADGFEADLILIDYLQRLHASDTGGGAFRDKRTMTNAVLDAIRGFANHGRGFLVLSSVGRQPSGKYRQSSYDRLTIASFKESGDIEYSADNAFILVPPAAGYSVLKHVKARNSETEDIPLAVRLDVMTFDPVTSSPPSGAAADLLAAARGSWGAAPPKGGAG